LTDSGTYENGTFFAQGLQKPTTPLYFSKSGQTSEKLVLV
jgi:hypothetical protein